jgi:hypothetical protein
VPRRYPVEFRRKVLDLIEAATGRRGRCAAGCDGPDDLQLAEPGPDRSWPARRVSTAESAELAAARKRIRAGDRVGGADAERTSC